VSATLIFKDLILTKAGFQPRMFIHVTS